MSRRNNYFDDWDEQKRYFARNLFGHLINIPSPIPEESSERHPSESSIPPDNTHADPEPDHEDLPPLNIEVIPKVNKHDDPPEYYQKLAKKVLKMWKRLFIEDRSDISDITDSDMSLSDPVDAITVETTYIEPEIDTQLDNTSNSTDFIVRDPVDNNIEKDNTFVRFQNSDQSIEIINKTYVIEENDGILTKVTDDHVLDESVNVNNLKDTNKSHVTSPDVSLSEDNNEMDEEIRDETTSSEDISFRVVTFKADVHRTEENDGTLTKVNDDHVLDESVNVNNSKDTNKSHVTSPNVSLSEDNNEMDEEIRDETTLSEDISFRVVNFEADVHRIQENDGTLTKVHDDHVLDESVNVNNSKDTNKSHVTSPNVSLSEDNNEMDEEIRDETTSSEDISFRVVSFEADVHRETERSPNTDRDESTENNNNNTKTVESDKMEQDRNTESLSDNEFGDISKEVDSDTDEEKSQSLILGEAFRRTTTDDITQELGSAVLERIDEPNHFNEDVEEMRSARIHHSAESLAAAAEDSYQEPEFVKEISRYAEIETDANSAPNGDPFASDDAGDALKPSSVEYDLNASPASMILQPRFGTHDDSVNSTPKSSHCRTSKRKSTSASPTPTKKAKRSPAGNCYVSSPADNEVSTSNGNINLPVSTGNAILSAENGNVNMPDRNNHSNLMGRSNGHFNISSHYSFFSSSTNQPPTNPPHQPINSWRPVGGGGPNSPGNGNEARKGFHFRFGMMIGISIDIN